MVARLLRALLLLLLPLLAWAGEVELHIATDQLAVGQTVTADVQVRGGTPAGIPALEGSDGITARYAGQSQTVSIVNGRAERFVQYQYQVSALKEGELTLGPVKVEVADARGVHTAVSNQLRIKVGPAPKADAPDERFQVDTKLTPEVAWLGQVVILSYGYRARSPVVAAEWFGLPQDGMVIVRDTQPERKEYAVDDPAGTLWVDDTRVAVLPMAAGDKAWDPPVARLDVDRGGGGGGGIFRSMFRQTERIAVTGDAMKLQVKPLPQAPADFSGLVGNFQVSTHLERKRAKVGDSLTWRIDIQGDGTTESFKPPPELELEGARVYDEAPQARGALVRDGFLGAVTLNRTIVPTRVGQLQIPGFSVTVFSTTSGQYEKLHIPPERLDVAAGEAGEAELTTFGEEPGEVEEEEDPNALRPARRSGGTNLGVSFVWVLASLPFVWLATAPLLRAGLTALRERLRRREEGPREAGPEDLLAALPDDPAARLARLDDALRLAVARATGVPVEELDLREAHVPDDLLALARTLDLARFAGKAPPPDLVEQVRAAVQRLGRSR